jgi:hypothetical protein
LLIDRACGSNSSKWKPQQQSDSHKNYEICCGCQLDEEGKTSLIAPADQGNNASRQRVTNEASRKSSDKKVTFRIHTGDNENDEDHHRTPEPPPGWTEAEILILKRAVEKAARTLQVKQPGFAAMQAIHGSITNHDSVFTATHVDFTHLFNCDFSPAYPFSPSNRPRNQPLIVRVIPFTAKQRQSSPLSRTPSSALVPSC